MYARIQKSKFDHDSALLLSQYRWSGSIVVVRNDLLHCRGLSSVVRIQAWDRALHLVVRSNIELAKSLNWGKTTLADQVIYTAL